VLSGAIYSSNRNKRKSRSMEGFSDELKISRARIEEFDDNFSRCPHSKLPHPKDI
jgi:hypothetical protein